MKTLSAFVLLSFATTIAQEPPAPAETTEQHEWLQQLVGEWTTRCEVPVGPGEEPMVVEGTERVRSIGGLWIVAEGEAKVGDIRMQSMLTLGYDPAKKAFVGTWVDSMQTHLWTYRGRLDEDGAVLTLEAEGPAFDDPTQTATYRDVIELKGEDQRVLRSSVRGADGEWTTFMVAEYRRKK